MKISVFLLASFIVLFSNVDNLIGDFESDYMNAEKKMSKSKTFNKKMMTQDKTYKNKMSNMNSMNKMSDMNSMDKTGKMNSMSKMNSMDSMNKMSNMNNMSAIEKTMKNHQSSNNKEDILKVINKEIEEYVDSLTPFIIVVCLFIILILIMYIMTSAMSTSSLKHKISVLENLLSSKLKDIGKNSSKEYHSLLNDVKKMNLRVTSIEAISQKILTNNVSASEHSKKIIDNKKVPTKGFFNKKEADKKINTDEFMLDDDFAMDENDDEGLNLDYGVSGNKKKTAPLSNLSSLDMNINTDSAKKKNKKTNIKEMEEFSLDDFNE